MLDYAGDERGLSEIVKALALCRHRRDAFRRAIERPRGYLHAGDTRSNAMSWIADRQPVLVKELRGRMRGGRAFVVLTLFLTVLSLFMLLLFLAVRSNVGTDPFSAGQTIGKTLFIGVVTIALIQVMIIVPAQAAAAITSERERETFDLLVATLLPSWKIILGKLLAALAYAVLLIVAVVPLMGIAFFFGGVTGSEVVIALLGSAGDGGACTGRWGFSGRCLPHARWGRPCWHRRSTSLCCWGFRSGPMCSVHCSYSMAICLPGLRAIHSCISLVLLRRFTRLSRSGLLSTFYQRAKPAGFSLAPGSARGLDSGTLAGVYNSGVDDCCIGDRDCHPIATPVCGATAGTHGTQTHAAANQNR